MAAMSMAVAVAMMLVVISAAHDPDTFQQVFCGGFCRTTNRDNSAVRMVSPLLEYNAGDALRDLEIMAVEGYADS